MDNYIKIQAYYSANFFSYTEDYKILGWESEEAQFNRFDVFANNTNINSKSLLDVGCGLGSLLKYLNNKNIFLDYTGIDILPEMTSEAKKRFPDKKFISGDLFRDDIFIEKSFDIVYASGIFNLNLGNNVEFLEKAVVKFDNITNNAIAFNLLHINSPSPEDAYFYFSPDEVIKIIENNVKDFKVIKVIEHYLKNDFTVVIEK